MRKILPIFIGILLFVFIFLNPSYAAKASNSSPQAYYSLNKYQTNLNVTFSNVKQAKQISYDLMYEANGIVQGVGGSIFPKGKNSISKNITLGTCSSGTCVVHKKIKKMKLTVYFNLQNKTITKSYSIKTK